MKGYLLMVFLFGALSGGSSLSAQTLALKTNLAADAVLSPNVSLDAVLSPRYSLEAGIHYQPFSFGENRRWKHWLGRVELRRWSCVPFSGVYWGIHLLGGQFNVGDVSLPFGLYRGTRTSRYEGLALGGGLSWGYQWILSSRWGMEVSAGAGAVFVRYDRYRCGHCGERISSNRHKTYLGPTRAAISLVYLLK